MRRAKLYQVENMQQTKKNLTFHVTCVHVLYESISSRFTCILLRYKPNLQRSNKSRKL
jgi:hypothetical protein